MDCKCTDCRKACEHRPGWFAPGEIEKASEYLKMSTKDFFMKYCSVDWWDADEEEDKTIFLVAPALKYFETGIMYPPMPTGECIFYNKDLLCEIHSHKPEECRKYMHDVPHEISQKVHYEIAMKWKQHQKQIEELLGGKPYAKELTFGDMIALYV